MYEFLSGNTSVCRYFVNINYIVLIFARLVGLDFVQHVCWVWSPAFSVVLRKWLIPCGRCRQKEGALFEDMVHLMNTVYFLSLYGLFSLIALEHCWCFYCCSSSALDYGILIFIWYALSHLWLLYYHNMVTPCANPLKSRVQS